MDDGSVNLEITEKIGTISFHHPKSNCLPSSLLTDLVSAVQGAAAHEELNAIVLRSEGDKTFCAGADFQELVKLDSLESGTEFFMGFANLILAMRACPIPIITRVPNKAVGGGVGIIAASDYSIACSGASIRLSELAIGLGPYVIEPAIERKVGTGHMYSLALSTEWHSASWAHNVGLYNELHDSEKLMDDAVDFLCNKYRKFSRDSLVSLKQVLWEGTSDWTLLLAARATKSAQLTIMEQTQNTLKQLLKK